ncbi:Enoyl-[acyl-carrier-protein] reductase [NADH] [Dyadobacter soli]|uniref:Enoyl-[acyl-carrier-protein] reductase [NADH] n=1 Tax=Dyadobacter soli TaxID=659014 RepID=A0A1G7Q0E1_9BACT|nr:SDR family oxidoreductase [Dyadobacter soli]SDF91928.1 Enoyl-[acyl-carrier-protein] reductase [NADH] [Dyadobacter soli]
MLLQNKTAVIYGAGGSLGAAVAKAFSAAGANLLLSGIHLEPVEATAGAIRQAGGKVQVDQVDALDEKAVNDYLSSVYKQTGAIDISFCAIGLKDTQDIPLVEMKLEDFVRPIQIAMQSQFITGTAAGRIMRGQKSGVILALTATPGGIGYPGTGGFGVACCAIESFTRNLASELGPHGIRVVTIRSGGSPDSRVFVEAIATLDKQTGEQILGGLRNDSMLKRLPAMHDIANTAVFAASDLATLITGTVIDVTGGATTALNYKTTEERSSIPPFNT